MVRETWIRFLAEKSPADQNPKKWQAWVLSSRKIRCYLYSCWFLVRPALCSEWRVEQLTCRSSTPLWESNRSMHQTHCMRHLSFLHNSIKKVHKNFLNNPWRRTLKPQSSAPRHSNNTLCYGRWNSGSMRKEKTQEGKRRITFSYFYLTDLSTLLSQQIFNIHHNMEM